MKRKNFKAEVVLHAPEENESDNCRERIFALVDRAVDAKNTALNESENQNKRDSAIHELKFIAKRILWETN